MARKAGHSRHMCTRYSNLALHAHRQADEQAARALYVGTDPAGSLPSTSLRLLYPARAYQVEASARRHCCKHTPARVAPSPALYEGRTSLPGAGPRSVVRPPSVHRVPCACTAGAEERANKGDHNVIPGSVDHFDWYMQGREVGGGVHI
eukprot:COSAG02_NODE_7751_length_2862_cov_3.193992_1_plen_148_part_10